MSKLRQKKREATLAAILSAAAVLFQQRGYPLTSMDDIADVANISRKTLFNYMISKEAIVISLIRQRFGSPYSSPLFESHDLITGDIEDIIAVEREYRLSTFGEVRWLFRIGVLHANLFTAGNEFAWDEHYFERRSARVSRIKKLQDIDRVRTDISSEDINWHFEIVRDSVFRRWLLIEDAKIDDLNKEFDDAMSIFFRGISP